MCVCVFCVCVSVCKYTEEQTVAAHRNTVIMCTQSDENLFGEPTFSISVSCSDEAPLKQSTAGINTRGEKDCLKGKRGGGWVVLLDSHREIKGFLRGASAKVHQTFKLRQVV